MWSRERSVGDELREKIRKMNLKRRREKVASAQLTGKPFLGEAGSCIP